MSLAFLFSSTLALPVYAGGDDPDPNADYMQQIKAEESRTSSSWASYHTSFPEVPSEQAQDFTCFMTTENNQTFNLEALCGRSTSSNPQETQRPSPDLNQN